MGLLNPISTRYVMDVVHAQLPSFEAASKATTELALPTSGAKRNAAVELLSAADSLLRDAADDARAIYPSDGRIPLPTSARRSDRLAESAMLRAGAAQDLIKRADVFPPGYMSSYRIDVPNGAGNLYERLNAPGGNELQLDTSVAIDMIGRRKDPGLLVEGVTSRHLTKAAAGELEQTRSTVQNARRRIINEDLVAAADRQAVAAVQELRADGLWNLQGTQQVDDATRLLMHEQIDAALTSKAATARPAPVTAGGLAGSATIEQFRTKVAHTSLQSALGDAGKLEGGALSMRNVGARLDAGERALLHAQMARHQLTNIDPARHASSIGIVDDLMSSVERKMHAVRTGDGTRHAFFQAPIFGTAERESQLSKAITKGTSLSVQLAEENRLTAHAAIAERAGSLSQRTLEELRLDHGAPAREQAMTQVRQALTDGMLGSGS